MTKRPDAKELKIKLVVEVTISTDIHKKYPNFQFNYEDQADFLKKNIILGMNHLNDDSNSSAFGYETSVLNDVLPYMEDKRISKGDKCAYMKIDGGKYSKVTSMHVGTITEAYKEQDIDMVKILRTLPEGKSITIKRAVDDIIVLSDLTETI